MRVVIASVQYADFLAVTLPAWCAIVPSASITVVTTARDTATQAIAAAHQVDCVVTDAWSRDRARFNKAAALDEAFGFGTRAGPTPGAACLSLDADVVPFGTLPHGGTLDRGTIDSCPRYDCPTPATLTAHRSGALPRKALSLIMPRTRGGRWPELLPHSNRNARQVAKRALGYFQLFRYTPGLRFGSFRSAGKYDLVFRDQFSARAMVPDFYVLHLGEQRRDNWTGRVVAPWRAA